MNDTHTQTQGKRALTIIGAGACSTTWTPEGGGPAFKFENDETSRSLYNDYQMHERVVYSFQSPPKLPRIQVPDCFNFITAGNQKWWGGTKERFSTPWTPRNCIITERVLPFSKDKMRLLIESNCLQGLLADSASQNVKDKEYLVKSYLNPYQPPKTYLELERRPCSQVDIPLNVDQMRDLGISEAHLNQYACTMAEALAAMHWIGRVDGRGVEYILAPPWGEAIRDDTISNCLGDHCMWVLDFDLCRDMSMDEAGVRQAVSVFTHEETFYPRPGKDNSHWLEFRKEYLRTSEERIEWLPLNEAKRNQRKALSCLFIDLIEQEL